MMNPSHYQVGQDWGLEVMPTIPVLQCLEYCQDMSDSQIICISHVFKKYVITYSVQYALLIYLGRFSC